jgi:hypothetical protein
VVRVVLVPEGTQTRVCNPESVSVYRTSARATAACQTNQPQEDDEAAFRRRSRRGNKCPLSITRARPCDKRGRTTAVRARGMKRGVGRTLSSSAMVTGRDARESLRARRTTRPPTIGGRFSEASRSGEGQGRLRWHIAVLKMKRAFASR